MTDLRASRLLEDLGAVQEFLAAGGHTRLGLVGSSMGAFAAAWFARQQLPSVLGCVFLAPAFRFLERRWNSLNDTERNEWRRTGRLPVRNEWVETELGYGLIEERDQYLFNELTSGWQIPALLFHGCADDKVPDSDSLDFLRAVQCPDVEVRLLKGGDHRLTAFKDEIADAAGRFFARLLAVPK
jgi:alpha-beta hydrolase superfamily lysophospholipase